MRLNLFTLSVAAVLMWLLPFIGTAVVPLFDPALAAPSKNGIERGQALQDPKVARGRQLYMQNGCVYCHSQYVRPVMADKALGDISQPGDYFYDRPHLMGSDRIGPDLMRVGTRIPDKKWHTDHLKDPRKVVPGSVMPRYDYLSDEDIDALVAYLLSLK